MQRTSFALLNNTIYIAFGSHCDVSAYHGFLLGYDKTTLQSVGSWNSTPSGLGGAAGGIWQSGAAPIVGLDSSVRSALWLPAGNGGGEIFPMATVHISGDLSPWNR